MEEPWDWGGAQLINSGSTCSLANHYLQVGQVEFCQVKKVMATTGANSLCHKDVFPSHLLFLELKATRKRTTKSKGGRHS